MTEVVLRLFIAAAAGATVRLLLALGVLPTIAGMLLLGVAGTVVSWRLDKSRILVVSLIACGYFVTYQYTLPEPVEVSDLGMAFFWPLIMNFSLPFALPAFGSLLGQYYERSRAAVQAHDEPITEESLLAEKIDLTKQPEISYEDLDLPLDPKVG
jgi:hypothetical protein